MTNENFKVGDLVVLNDPKFRSWENFLWKVVKKEPHILASCRANDRLGLPPKRFSVSDIKCKIPKDITIKFPWAYD